MAATAHGLIRLLLLGLCLGIGWQTARGDTAPLWQEEAQRLRVGLKIFPACLGALESLDEKRASDGSLVVVVVHTGASETAREAAVNLSAIGTLRGIRLRVETLSSSALEQGWEGPLGGIFVASIEVGSKRLRAWSERYRTLVFSPFAGDVEAGAVAGLYVADRILPYVNLAQAQRAQVRFKSFFLTVARQYE